MPPNLRYASVSAEVICARYRTPVSYQSRPPHPPSPAAVKAAVARAAAQVSGEEGWAKLINGSLWGTYSITKPLPAATYLVSRLQPPDLRKKGGKPSNVFPVGEYLGGELRLALIFDASTVPESLVIKSLLGTYILGDNDSIVVPKPSTLRVGEAREVHANDVVVTRYVFRLGDASPIEGFWLLAKLPTMIKPKDFRGTIRVERPGFEEVIIPAKRFGQVLRPHEVRARVTGGAVLEVGGGDLIIVPGEVIRE